MKKLFTVLLLSFSLSSFSQADLTRIEELENDITNLQNDIRFLKSENSENKNINLRLEKFRRQYFNGVGIQITGVIISCIGTGILVSSLENYTAGAVIGGLGGVIAFGGSITIITSHNKLKREQKE
ncbi:MAG: hypothetical protein KF900_12690 [Bacteroidetes bacterium]|nr:hypothetical protein [Bacteroidota bacterium]